MILKFVLPFFDRRKKSSAKSSGELCVLCECVWGGQHGGVQEDWSVWRSCTQPQTRIDGVTVLKKTQLTTERQHGEGKPDHSEYKRGEPTPPSPCSTGIRSETRKTGMWHVPLTLEGGEQPGKTRLEWKQCPKYLNVHKTRILSFEFQETGPLTGRTCPLHPSRSFPKKLTDWRKVSQDMGAKKSSVLCGVCVLHVFWNFESLRMCT